MGILSGIAGLVKRKPIVAPIIKRALELREKAKKISTKFDAELLIKKVEREKAEIELNSRRYKELKSELDEKEKERQGKEKEVEKLRSQLGKIRTADTVSFNKKEKEIMESAAKQQVLIRTITLLKARLEALEKRYGNENDLKKASSILLSLNIELVQIKRRAS